MDELLEEYHEQKRFVENEKPYWLFVDAERGTELSFNLFNYFPDAHYRKAIDHALEQDARDEEVVPDGGSRTQYYWSGEDGILYHTEKNEDRVNPFFETVEDAERFLEHQAEQHGKDRYEGFVLRKTGNRKVEEAVEVLMDQSGIQDFL